MFLSSKRCRYALVTLGLMFLAELSTAQLRRFPGGEALSRAQHTRSASGARVQEDAPLSLPFFDDFSKPDGVIYADTTLWQNSNSVWVNDGMAISPPTINVATFDGLNAAGTPYNPNEVLLTGYTDTLLSRPIDLSEAGVSVDERATVYLSFFYQWQGNVEAPDERDFLELSFKAAGENEWETVLSIYPADDADQSAFYSAIVPVSGEQFFHDKFQFMLRSFGRLSGPFDTWHVDYVYLNKGRNASDLSFPDRALSTQLGPLFGMYRAMPRNHFLSNDQMTPPTFEIQNMKNEPASINFRTQGYFSSTDRDKDITYPSHEVVISKATPINITDNVLFANEHRTVRMDTLPDIHDPLQFPQDPGIDSTIIRLTIALQTRDNIPFNRVPPVEPDSTGDYTRNYAPIRFTTNDTLTADYILSDYYAYDDGVAEFAAGLIEAGNLVAYEFEIDTSYSLKQDTLVGFDVYFPPYAITSNQTVDFFIYHEDPDNPGYPGELWLRIASKRILRKGVNEFQRFEFLPALLIDEKKFYLGWQQPSAGRVMVGLDVSNDTGGRIFVNTNGTWYLNEDVVGSLMLRPVFGSGIIDASVGIDERPTLAVFPNPSAGTFYIEGEVRDLRVYALTGEEIPVYVNASPHRSEVKVAARAPGLYLMRCRRGNKLYTAKIVIRSE